MQAEKIYSVSEANSIVRDLLETRMSGIALSGEISNFVHHGSGHMYFTLKDDESELRCAMFRHNNSKLRFKPDNGTEVIARGNLSVYVPRGNYQMIVQELSPAGAGALQQAFDALKEKLRTEGLFDAGRKRALPAMPASIGIITSPSGAAIRDVLSVLERRFPLIQVDLYPVRVQGDGAAMEIVTAIEHANARRENDVLLLTRGGGSLEDLWSFNEEAVARAVAASDLPIVAGVGHETDFTIADFAADLRAPTPSAAAELLVPDAREIRHHLEGIQYAFGQSLTRLIQQHQQSVDFQARRLARAHPLEKLRLDLNKVESMTQRLHRAMLAKLKSVRIAAQPPIRSLALLNPAERLKQARLRAENAQQQLKRAIRQQLTTANHRLLAADNALRKLGPESTLARGYAIVSDDAGKVLTSINEAATGERVYTRLRDGTLVSVVERIDPDASSRENR